MPRIHEMPFGAELTAKGVRFRLWAPGARRIDLCLEDPPGIVEAMDALPSGWFERVSTRARPGSRYRFRLDDRLRVPDPASRFNPEGVHGSSLVVDPRAFQWQDNDWRGRPWKEAIIYELHVGTFTPEGTFRAAAEKLDYLVDLGVSALNLMPVGAFPGKADWGYDGTLLFAPSSTYGTPDDLKLLVQTAHQKGLMVFLDVVYNHFGPEGNYLYVYAQPFFNTEHSTPWGNAINFDGPDSRPVRDFFLHNSLFWLEEYHLDGLRLDAVHAIADSSKPDILEELAGWVHAGPGRHRPVHLILENDRNDTRFLQRKADGSPCWYSAQWNDDFHHALHCLLTGERDGYYQDYADAPAGHLGRALSEGFAYQGEPSPYRDGQPRGMVSRDLPPSAFIGFLQNHDQIGNRAYGERLSTLADARPLRVAATLLLLAPSPPLLFMGEEFASLRPFLFFCDFGGDLAAAVTAGRRDEFKRFPRFAAPGASEKIPDPCDPSTFLASKLDWSVLGLPGPAAWLAFYRRLLKLRRDVIIPRLEHIVPGRSRYRVLAENTVEVVWPLSDGDELLVWCHLGQQPVTTLTGPTGTCFAASDGDVAAALAAGTLPAWSAAWFLGKGGPG